MSLADNPIFHDANAAREWLESLLCPEGPICPHCGLVGAAHKLNGKKQRAGLADHHPALAEIDLQLLAWRRLEANRRPRFRRQLPP